MKDDKKIRRKHAPTAGQSAGFRLPFGKHRGLTIAQVGVIDCEYFGMGRADLGLAGHRAADPEVPEIQRQRVEVLVINNGSSVMEGHVESDTGGCTSRRFDDPIEADDFRRSLSRGCHVNGSFRPEGDLVIIWCSFCVGFHLEPGSSRRGARSLG